jgi:hypothetical protein
LVEGGAVPGDHPDEGGAVLTRVELASLTVAQLKERCKRQGLAVGGRKAALISRLSATGEVEAVAEPEAAASAQVVGTVSDDNDPPPASRFWGVSKEGDDESDGESESTSYDEQDF